MDDNEIDMGFGDTIERIIKKTKLDKLLGKENCSKCRERKEQLNKRFPYND